MSSHLKTFRKSQGLSQGQLAARLGISKSMVSMVENGRRDLPGAASRKLEALRQESQATTGSPGLSAGHSFRELAIGLNAGYKRNSESCVRSIVEYEAVQVVFCLTLRLAQLHMGLRAPRAYNLLF